MNTVTIDVDQQSPCEPLSPPQPPQANAWHIKPNAMQMKYQYLCSYALTSTLFRFALPSARRFRTASSSKPSSSSKPAV